jgi:microcystin-dependent protein
MPIHDHGKGNHDHSEKTFREVRNNWKSGGGASPGDGTGDGSASTTTGPSGNIINPEGGDLPHENRPKFWALAYIMKK